MQLQIRQLVVWPRNPAVGPRTLDFALGQVNVITGASKTGKSAVIPIIDYCLGSDRCAIPVRTIRDACSWFGLVVATEEGEKLLARREPRDQQGTADMFLLEAAEIKIPQTIPEKNASVDGVKRMLDRLSGLSNLGFEPITFAGGYKGRPSFRDLISFTFQPQNIVANPDVLFYKADTVEHREKLRTIFPYVLGAVTPEILLKRWEADRLQQELRRRERELNSQTQATETWKAELRTWVSEALELGLVSHADADSVKGESELVGLLQKIVGMTSRESHVTADTVDASSREAADLAREEERVTLELSEVRSRLEQMLLLRNSVDEYTGALKKQRDRLELSRWLRELHTKDTRCPICGGAYEEGKRELDVLCDALADVEASARQFSPIPAVFDKELVQVRDKVRHLADRLQAVRVRKHALEERSATSKEARLRAAAVDRFLGRAEQALKMFAAPSSNNALKDEVDQIRRDLDELRVVLSESGIRNRIRAAQAQVSLFMSRFLPILDVERPNDPTELNTDELTIRVTGPSGRSDFLWEIGSGANWLSYHVAATLGLHRLFLEQKGNPVPSFIVYDQPSQVYFPKWLTRETVEGDDPKLRDEDVVAVRKVFAVFGQAVMETKRALQIIVLDHAGSDVWHDLPGIHLVEEWRDGRALIPNEWIPIR